jgi:hypothetical protein
MITPTHLVLLCWGARDAKGCQLTAHAQDKAEQHVQHRSTWVMHAMSVVNTLAAIKPAAAKRCSSLVKSRGLIC